MDTHSPRNDGPRLAKRWLLALGLTAVNMSLFWWVGARVDPTTAASLWTPIDRAIPFLPWTVYLYSWVYTSMLYPAFVVRDPELFDRVLRAYALVLGLSLLSFWAFPVGALELRPDTASLDPTIFHDWAVILTYHVDPPTNLFPSEHLSIATLSMLCAWTARRSFGLLALPIVASVAVSILTMKQHFIADGLASLPLAVLAWFLFVRGYEPKGRSRREAAWSWHGPAAYLAFHALFYGAFYVAFLRGMEP